MEKALRFGRVIAIGLVAGNCGPTAPAAPAAPTGPGGSPRIVGDPVCPTYGCGLNGIWLGLDVRFHELDLGRDRTFASRDVNNLDLKIESFRDSAQHELAIDVAADVLIGRQTPQGPPVDLVGSVLTLVTSKPPISRYFLTIEKVSSSNFWTDVCGDKCGDRVPLYTINFTREGSAAKAVSVCKPLLDSDATIEDTVVIFRGDRYDGDNRVTVDVDTSWFNIACQPTAIAKLHMLHHTSASRDRLPRRETNGKQRQAMLRLLTADYCGSGHGFTVDGHPLAYTFQQSWEPLYPAPFAELALGGSVEGLWDENGAVCIGTPRLSTPRTAASLMERIRAECGQHRHRLESCASAVPDHAALMELLSTKHAYAISANRAQ